MGGPGSGSKPRQYPDDIVTLACELYEAGLTVAEIRAVFPKGYRVQTILERHLPERRAAAKRDQRGPKNHAWRGDDASYGAVHLRLGKASERRCTDCGEAAAHWSYQGGCPDERTGTENGCAYCAHPKHYWPRCLRCHFHYDFKGRRPNGQLAAREEVMPHV